MGGEGARGEETGSKRILFAVCYHHSESSVAARSSVKDPFHYLVPGPPSSPRACYVRPLLPSSPRPLVPRVRAIWNSATRSEWPSLSHALDQMQSHGSLNDTTYIAGAFQCQQCVVKRWVLVFPLPPQFFLHIPLQSLGLAAL